ncbi:Werner syndrome ATP-dependent helicase-like protein [Morus notabilis]|uniref:Werner syndrome ATP-dependent helicase-like protein n=1 Tax=Morus notabilis TaxID=981085 RepID=W9RLA2_9ROSA|nr:exonuclease 3'-5' domain-containing protein 2 [Morus notabilis]EXB96387.1 Werner syndrome ATP-dependent helicase-like protein [Morus notabilis]
MASLANINNIHEEFKSYDIEFYELHIKTIVTADPETVNCWISENLHENFFLGLDTEWKIPINVSKPRSHDQHVTLLQLCTENRCLIFQLSHAPEIPRSLPGFLGDSNVTFAGVGVKQDAEKLMKDWGLSAGKTMDVAFSAAEKYGQSDYKCKGLKCFVEILLGMKIVSQFE